MVRTRESEPLAELREQVVAEILSLSPDKRILSINAALTELSREVFQRCVTANDAQAEADLKKLKICFWHFAKRFYNYVFNQPTTSCLVTEIDTIGVVGHCRSAISEPEYLRLLDFPFRPKNASEKIERIDLQQGFLSYLYKYEDEDKEVLKTATKDVFETIKDQWKQGNLQYFFGNVANGNFDAAFLTNYCQAPFDRFRLYQVSRKAFLTYGEKAGEFRTLTSEFTEINKASDGICLVDGFCAWGHSIEKSILGFRQRGFRGPIYIFIAYGSMPTMKIRTEQVYPQKPLLTPGDEIDGPIFLKVK